MRFFGWLAFLVALIVAIFAIQNAALSSISVKLFAWQVETSPVFAILGSFIAGILIAVLLWIPHMFRRSFQFRALRKQVKALQENAEQAGKETGEDPVTDHGFSEQGLL